MEEECTESVRAKYCNNMCFCFQAEDGIRDAQESRGLGDVYKRQIGVLHRFSSAMMRAAASTSWPAVSKSSARCEA